MSSESPKIRLGVLLSEKLDLRLVIDYIRNKPGNSIHIATFRCNIKPIFNRCSKWRAFKLSNNQPIS
jgi:hypothetical protein